MEAWLRGLLEHAVQKSLYTWLPASTNTILPDPDTPGNLRAIFVRLQTRLQDEHV